MAPKLDDLLDWVIIMIWWTWWDAYDWVIIIIIWCDDDDENWAVNDTIHTTSKKIQSYYIILLVKDCIVCVDK